MESDQLRWAGRLGRQGAGEMGKGLGGVHHLGGVWGAVQEVGAGRWLEST